MPPTTTSQTRTEPDAEAIMDAALREEGPPPVKGVVRMSEKEETFQRRVALAFTIGPLLGVVLAIYLLWGTGISPTDFWIFLGLYFFTGMGVTVGFHRLFTHRSFQVPTWVRAVLAVAGSMSVQGNLIGWVAAHRRHHAYADEYGDPHSPHLVQDTGIRGVLKGLWHAHMGWFFEPEGTDASIWAPDLLEEDVLVRVDRNFEWLTLASFLLPGAIGFALTQSLWGTFTALIWGGMVRIFLLHHVTWSINSICHFYGERPFESRDESTNNWAMALLAFGEGWHNNHHAFPTSARHGILRGQLDISWRFIRTLEQLGLATDVKRVTQRMADRKWAGHARRRRLARG